jgi:small-conductance mechanosensitive channel/CRP-like cAMP-binding protein
MASMIDEFLATILFLLAAIAWRFMPRRPAWLAPGSILVLFTLLTAVVIRSAGSPFAPAFGQASPPVALWHQAIMAAWWIIAAKCLLAIGAPVLLFGRRSREAKLASELISAAIYLAAVLHVISTVFAVPIGGLVATSGVIAIVLGLALQNTLADVFAGIAVGIEGPISVGDRVWIEGGLEGEIVEINWRAIRIRTDGNDIAIVPHSVIAKARLINRSYPTARRGDATTITCDPGVSPDHAIDLVKRALLLCPTVLKEPAPSVALVRLGMKRNKYEVAFSVSSSALLWNTRSVLLKEIARQFHYAGVQPVKRRGLSEEGASVAGESIRSTTSDDTFEPPESHSLQRLLGEFSLFHDLPEDCRNHLADNLIRHALQPQDIVFSQGATEASLYIVASGVLEVARKTPERAYVLGRIGPGDYIGEIGLLTGAPHAATVTALTPCLVYELRKDDIASLLAKRPELVSAFEASARRGQELIARAVAASVNPHVGSSGQLLTRIRAFFNLPS